jgi:hypothetical protein
MAIDIVPERTNPVQVCQVSEILVKYMVEGPDFLKELVKIEDPPAQTPEQRRKGGTAR